MNSLRIFFLLLCLTSVGIADDKMEDYMENCVDDYYKTKSSSNQKELDSVVFQCASIMDINKARFYYYKGKIYSKPRR